MLLTITLWIYAVGFIGDYIECRAALFHRPHWAQFFVALAWPITHSAAYLVIIANELGDG